MEFDGRRAQRSLVAFHEDEALPHDFVEDGLGARRFGRKSSANRGSFELSRVFTVVVSRDALGVKVAPFRVALRFGISEPIPVVVRQRRSGRRHALTSCSSAAVKVATTEEATFTSRCFASRAASCTAMSSRFSSAVCHDSNFSPDLLRRFLFQPHNLFLESRGTPSSFALPSSARSSASWRRRSLSASASSQIWTVVGESLRRSVAVELASRASALRQDPLET